MSKKPYLTIKQQIQLLEDRGVIIDDYKNTEDFLYRNNYYMVNGYTLTLRSNNHFYDVKFTNIISIYRLDAKIRIILLKYLLNVETTIKSVYAHEFAKEYSPTAYLKDDVFTSKRKYAELTKKSESLRSKQIKSEMYIKHYNDINQDMPIWAYVGVLTFSDISKLYRISQYNLQKTICDYFHVFRPNILVNHLHSLSILRNICAHGGRLYNRAFTHKPNLSKKEKQLLIINDDKLVNNRLCSYLICFKNLLKKNEFKELIDEIKDAVFSYPDVDISYYGLKDSWYGDFSKAL